MPAVGAAVGTVRARSLVHRNTTGVSCSHTVIAAICGGMSLCGDLQISERSTQRRVSKSVAREIRWMQSLLSGVILTCAVHSGIGEPCCPNHGEGLST
jgi:hypothetical protein